MHNNKMGYAGRGRTSGVYVKNIQDFKIIKITQRPSYKLIDHTSCPIPRCKGHCSEVKTYAPLNHETARYPLNKPKIFL